MRRLVDSKEKLELERLQQDTERMKVELERSTLQLIQKGTLPPGGFTMINATSDVPHPGV